MGSFSRVEVPSNFFDITSAMLLAQPEPQYLYADLFKRALGASLQVPGQLGFRPIGGAGAPYGSEQDDRLLLANQLSSDIFATTVNFSGMAGSTIRINRPSYTDSTYTAASRLISSGTTISTTPITVAQQQTNLTLFRYGGPYDNDNTEIRPYGIEAFDAQMGVHSAAAIHGRHIKRDFDKFMDAVWVTLFDLAATAVYPEGISTVDGMTVAGDFPFTLEQLTRVQKLMDEANLPTFPDGFRILVITPQQEADLSLDGNYTNLARNHPVYNSLFPSYVSSVKKFHIFKSTTLNTTANSSSVPVQYGHAIAPGAGMGGMGRPPRVSPNTQDNYGELALFVWLADLAFALANNTFVYSVRSG